MSTPTLHFLEVGHDAGCPGRYTNGEGCCCDFSVTLHHDQERFLRGEAINRAARRKAAREAEKALRRARRAKK
jgi:hypothetical protein